MKKLLLLLALTTNIIFAQKTTCDSNKDSIEELNSVTKCKAGSTEKIDHTKTRGLAVKTSTASNRYHKNNSTLAAIAKSRSSKKSLNFNEISSNPEFYSCTGLAKDRQSKCFNIEMSNHIKKHFNYPSQAIADKIEGRVWVSFVINDEGNVEKITPSGPKGGELLNEEATRIVSKLPKFKPGKNKGNTVPVKYGVLVSFSLD